MGILGDIFNWVLTEIGKAIFKDGEERTASNAIINSSELILQKRLEVYKNFVGSNFRASKDDKLRDYIREYEDLIEEFAYAEKARKQSRDEYLEMRCILEEEEKSEVYEERENANKELNQLEEDRQTEEEYEIQDQPARKERMMKLQETIESIIQEYREEN